MCLHTIERTYKPPIAHKRGRVVWKALEVGRQMGEATPRFPYGAVGLNCSVLMDKVLTATGPKLDMDDGILYKTGFHCFISRKDALKYKSTTMISGSIVVPVTVWDVMYRGTQSIGKKNSVPCIVAKRMCLKKTDFLDACRRFKVVV